MKTNAFFASLIAMSMISAAAVQAQNTAAERFEQLKSLAGEWTGSGPGGLALTVSYEVVSGGQAVMETRRPENEPDMVTLFYLDGNDLMLTHYCSAGNQPRMRAVASDDDLRFDFVDVTNLGDADEGHMRGLAYTFDGDDQLVQTWTWRQDGRDMPAVFEMKRNR